MEHRRVPWGHGKNEVICHFKIHGCGSLKSVIRNWQIFILPGKETKHEAQSYERYEDSKQSRSRTTSWSEQRQAELCNCSTFSFQATSQRSHPEKVSREWCSCWFEEVEQSWWRLSMMELAVGSPTSAFDPPESWILYSFTHWK